MSHPLLGNIEEVNGGFTAHVLIDLVVNDPAKGTGYEISLDKSTFKIENEYYNELYEKGVICPVLKVVCDNTLLSMCVNGFESVFVREEKLDKLIKAECCFAAVKKFTFNPKKESVNSFFIGESTIEKGYIMSTKKTTRVNLKQGFSGGQSELVRFQHDSSLSDEFEIEWGGADVDGKILVKVKNKEFVEGVKETLNKPESKKLALNSFLGPVLIAAIGRLGNDEEDCFWAEELRRLVGYVEEEKHRYKEEDFCMNKYNQVVNSEKGVIADALNQLRVLLNNDE